MTNSEDPYEVHYISVCPVSVYRFMDSLSSLVHYYGVATIYAKAHLRTHLNRKYEIVKFWRFLDYSHAKCVWKAIIMCLIPILIRINMIMVVLIHIIWAMAFDFQQCGMCNQQRLRPACAYAVWSETIVSHLNILRVLSYWLNSIWSF